MTRMTVMITALPSNTGLLKVWSTDHQLLVDDCAPARVSMNFSTKHIVYLVKTNNQNFPGEGKQAINLPTSMNTS